MKTAGDNGTHIPLDFIAELTGNDEASLRQLADERSYSIPK
jgi:acetolactate synthase I/II/III large subunit